MIQKKQGEMLYLSSELIQKKTKGKDTLSSCNSPGQNTGVGSLSLL